uniref:Uncharacterized protein n=1 Tax=Romanomermis culicivorax TaxID=13658 RepID=A0A915HWS4_ROMCU
MFITVLNELKELYGKKHKKEIFKTLKKPNDERPATVLKVVVVALVAAPIKFRLLGRSQSAQFSIDFGAAGSEETEDNDDDLLKR